MKASSEIESGVSGRVGMSTSKDRSIEGGTRCGPRKQRAETRRAGNRIPEARRTRPCKEAAGKRALVALRVDQKDPIRTSTVARAWAVRKVVRALDANAKSIRVTRHCGHGGGDIGVDHEIQWPCCSVTTFVWGFGDVGRREPRPREPIYRAIRFAATIAALALTSSLSAAPGSGAKRVFRQQFSEYETSSFDRERLGACP
jgi:hypothetical protein